MSEVDKNQEIMMPEAFFVDIRLFFGYDEMFHEYFFLRLDVNHQTCTLKAYTIVLMQQQFTMLLDLLGLKIIMR
jgi:hypothetical protein